MCNTNAGEEGKKRNRITGRKTSWDSLKIAVGNKTKTKWYSERHVTSFLALSVLCTCLRFTCTQRGRSQCRGQMLAVVNLSWGDAGASVCELDGCLIYIYSLFFNYSCNNSLKTFFVSVLLFLPFCVCNGARVVRMDSFQTAVLRDCQYLGTTEEQVRPRGLCRHCRHSLLLFQPPPNTGVRPFIATFLSSFLSFRPFHISCLFIWLGGNSGY